jgi:NAD(P)-dependent dehydrogenase (short-subunit alcohol dehydrogenase family)
VPCAPPALSRHGHIDGLVNNAGVSLHNQATKHLDPDESRRVLDLNVVGRRHAHAQNDPFGIRSGSRPATTKQCRSADLAR